MVKVKCTNCNTTMQSMHRHDFVSCRCSNQTFVDGGSDYLRCGGVDLRFVTVVEDDGTEVSLDVRE